MKRLPFYRLLVALSLGVGIWLGQGALAAATPNQAPDPTYFNPYPNEQWLLSSHAFAADSNFIDSPVSQVKLYSTTPNFSVRIENPNVCRNGQSLDTPFMPTGSPIGSFTSFRVYPLAPDEATPNRGVLLATYTGTAQNQTDAQPCGNSVTLNFSIGTPSTIPGHAGMYVAYFEAVFGGTTRGFSNRFKLSMSDPNGIIAYSDGSGVSQAYKFAMIADRRPTEFWGRGTYWSTSTLPFAPSCDVTSPQVVQLRWFDDDYLQFNQTRTITMELQKLDATTRALVSSQNLGTPTAGPNAPGSRTVTIEPGYVYQWVWRNVQYNNGIQFQLPYDSIYFYKPCPATNDFDLQPIINTAIDGDPAAGNKAEVGQTVTFRYLVRNAGTTASVAADCRLYRNIRTGYVVPSPPTASSTPGGYVPPPTSCPRIFNSGTTTQVAAETVVLASPNQSVCRSLFVDPATPGGGPEGVEQCVYVVNKPYLKVYGGDVMAGSGQEVASVPDVCVSNPEGTFVSWNKGPGTYAAAGAQYAVTALAAISHFASSQGGGASSLPPQGLSFANVGTVPAAGMFGGTIGAVPCLRDYYAARPTGPGTLGPVVSVDDLTGGRVYRNGNLRLNSGMVEGGERNVVYVNGDVYITGNITYDGAWNAKDVPLLQLVAQGNIYIDKSVTQLTGIFIAQRDGGTGGSFISCAEGFGLVPLDGNLYNRCRQRLMLQGSVVAHYVELTRTVGTQLQAIPGETPASTNIAESLNYGPAFWIPQSPTAGLRDGYDAITSLPPVL